MWMNEYDVLDAVQTWADEPLLAAATQTLQNLMDKVNANSDGWAYWTAPQKAAAKLEEVIQLANAYDRRGVDLPLDDVRSKLRKALVPIKSSRTRSGLHFVSVDLPE